jgi:8-oxo-dGTP pyrophosphatase MutT (NUDIX family)
MGFPQSTGADIVRNMKTVVAAYCFRGKGSDHKILLVTSSTGRWIVPKGKTEKRWKKRQVALMEAWEEGGVKGRVVGRAESIVIRRGEKAEWKFYPVKIHELKDDWPEKASRKRCLVSRKEARKLIDNTDLAEAVAKLAKKFR